MTLIAKNLDQPDDTMQFPNGRGDVVKLGDVAVTRAEFQPGWRWSNDIKPVAGTAACEVQHTGYLLRGHLHVEHADGTVLDLREGDVYDIAPGHDAWVVGDTAVGMIDWSGNVAFPGQGR